MSTRRLVRNVVCSLLVLAAAITVLVLLQAPLYLYVVLALSLLGILQSSGIHDCLPSIWLLLHVVCVVLSLYIDAPWVETVQTIVNLWLPGVVALVAAYFSALWYLS